MNISRGAYLRSEKCAHSDRFKIHQTLYEILIHFLIIFTTTEKLTHSICKLILQNEYESFYF